MNIEEILEVLPHRYPFLLVDRITEVEPGKRAVGFKNVTINEPFFEGHFPGRPIMPGVLILEAMAQVGACALLSQPEHRGKIGLFAGVDNARFRRQVLPGDRLDIEIDITAVRGRIVKARAQARVDGQPAAEADLTFAVSDKEAGA